MRIQLLCFLATPLLLAGCGSITVPAAVKMDNGEAYVGTTTAALSGGTFQVSATSGAVSCSGTYDALDTNPVISAPVRCSDGRYGTITVIRNPDMRGGAGSVRLADGTGGSVAFGKNAASVFAASPSYSALSSSASSGTGNCPTPDSIAADGKRCGARAAGYKGNTYQTYSRPALSYRTYYRGPRGGCYYLTGGGNKVYVDRSMC